MLTSSEQNDPHQILLNRGFDCFKLIGANLNERDKLCEYHSCLKTMIKTQLHVGFSMLFMKRASLK